MAIYISGVKNLPEQVQANKDNIATNTSDIATNTSDITDIKDEQITQNGRLTAVEGVASGEVIDRKLLIDDLTLGGNDYTRVKGTNILVKADDTDSYISIKGDDTLHIYQTQADDSGSSIQMSSTGVQIASNDEDGVIQGRIKIKANGDIEMSRQYEGTTYTKIEMDNQGIYFTDTQGNELDYVNGNLTLNDDPLIHHLYRHTIQIEFNDGNDVVGFTCGNIYTNSATLTKSDVLYTGSCLLSGFMYNSAGDNSNPVRLISYNPIYTGEPNPYITLCDYNVSSDTTDVDFNYEATTFYTENTEQIF